MLRTILKSKIDKARITETNLNYEGSITIDSLLMNAADILPYEKVDVLNLANGSRISTYAIKGARNSGKICLNGPASYHGKIGEEVIILSYCITESKNARQIKPRIIKLNLENRIQD